MTTITTRNAKGSTLTFTECDTNFYIGVQAKSSNYGFVAGDNRDTIEFNGSSLTCTLPDASIIAGTTNTGDYQITIKNLNASALTVARTSTDTIDGATSFTLQQYESVTVKVNQAQDGWDIIAYVVHQDNVDITGGTIDGTAIGGTTPAAVAGTTGDFSGNATVGGTLTVTGTLSSGDITRKYKSADETVTSSTTLQDDDHLTGFNLTAGKYYKVRGVLMVTDGGGSGGIKLSPVCSQTPQGIRIGFVTMAVSAQYMIMGESSGASVAFATSHLYTVNTLPLTIDGFIQANASTGGTFKLQWAQDASDPTATTVYKGSYLELIQLN